MTLKEAVLDALLTIMLAAAWAVLLCYTMLHDCKG